MKVKFIHFRHHEPDVIQDGTIILGEYKPFGGMTIAYYEANGEVSGFAIARCHTNDRYVKSQGRIIATGRLHSSTYFTQVKMAVADFHKEADALWRELNKEDFHE